MKRVGFFKKTIRDVPLDGQTVLLRAGFDLPMNEDGTIADDLRIRTNLPTIKYLLDRGCKVVIISHLGRPEGRDPKFSLEPAAQRLAELLGESVRFVDQTIGDKVKMAVKRAPKRCVIVLENLRFYEGEGTNDPRFAKQIVTDTGARYFVEDAFSDAHRAHASTAAITAYVPSVSGLLLEQEYTMITAAMKSPERPLVAVMGGAKVSDKIQVIEAFVHVADKIIIGGAMANTFMAYKGCSMGKSKVETDQNQTIENIYEAIKEKVGADKVDNFLILPTDFAVAASIKDDATRKVVMCDQIGADEMALDIGDESIKHLQSAIADAKTVIWNGTLGYAELEPFAIGSAKLCEAIITHPGITSIIGGGDTADFVLGWDSKKGDSFSHISTGGGASLELMAGEKLPGIESLLDA